MNDGRHYIFYDNLTGDIIVHEARNRLNIMPTIERVIEIYPKLHERDESTYDVLVLGYDLYAQDFATCNGYRVNTETKELEFSYPDPNDPEVEQPYQVPLSVEVEELKNDNKLLKAQNKANADRADFHEDLIAEMAMMVYS